MAIKLRFVTSNDAISAMIRAAEYGFWASHVEAAMPDGMYLGAHLEGGVRERPVGYDGKTRTREVFVELPADDAMTDAFHAFLRKQLGKPYDVGGIAALVVQRDWKENDSWYCSELQAAALVACGWMQPPPTTVSKITPRDLLMIVGSRVPVAA